MGLVITITTVVRNAVTAMARVRKGTDMSKRKDITVDLSDLYLDESLFTGSINDIIDKLVTLRGQLEERGFHTVRISLDNNYDGLSIDVIGVRKETATEAARRIEKAKKIAETKRRNRAEANKIKEQQERELLAKLKEKYE